MDEHTDQAQEQEADEAQGNVAARELGDQQAQEVEDVLQVELGIASRACAECVGYFDNTELAARGCQDIEQNLEAFGGKIGRYPYESRLAEHEEAAHGVAHVDR